MPTKTTFDGFDQSEFQIWIQEFVTNPDQELFVSSADPMWMILNLPFSVGPFMGGKVLSNHVFLSSDGGKNFRQMELGGFSGTKTDYVSTVIDPQSGLSHKIIRKGKTLTFQPDAGTVISCQELSVLGGWRSQFHPVPEVRKTEYLITLADGRYVYVTSVRYNYSYDTFRFYMGTPSHMQELAIKIVNRWHDGGSTVISTSMGTLIAGFRLNPFWTTNVLQDGDRIDFSGSSYPEKLEGLKIVDYDKPEILALIKSFNLIQLQS